MMRRPIVLLMSLTLGFLVAPVAAMAQPPMENRQWPSGDADFLEELRTLGYVVGDNLVFVPSYAETREQLPTLAAELVRHPVDLIITYGTPATRAAHQATATLPIVFALGTDPVQSGLVASDARPGGNLTGLASGFYEGKMPDLLRASQSSCA